MTRQVDLFDTPVSILSHEFVKRLASALVARSGVSSTEAFDLCKRAVDGRLCPTCGRLVKLYSRKLNAGMVKVLRQLYTRGECDPVPSRELDARGGDYAKLVLFGLVNTDENGLWSITQQGRDFLDGYGVAPSKVFIFMDELVGVSVASCRLRGNVDAFKLDHVTPAGVERVYIK